MCSFQYYKCKCILFKLRVLPGEYFKVIKVGNSENKEHELHLAAILLSKW